ncbi:MAG: hypothetical protein RLZZ440_774 [Planctomycetota bacterium]
MAVNRTQQSGLTIALIVFVMLTFILAAATYFGFSGRQKALDDQAAAEKQAQSASNDLRQAQQDLEAMRAVIGVPPNTSVAEIETGLASLFEGDFAGFDKESQSYMNLVGWLREEFRDLSGKVKTAEGDKQVLASQSGADAERLKKELSDWKQEAETAKAAQASQKQDFDARWAKVEEEKAKLLADAGDAQENAKQLRGLEAEIGKAIDYMSAAQQEPFAAGDAFARLQQIFALLAANKRQISGQNELLATLRVADPATQQAVAKAIGSDDRIDGFDGRIVDIDPRSNTVLLTSRTTAGLRPGLVLHVFDPDDPRPEFGSRKAVVQVTEIEGPTMARATILRDKTADPILAGDGVSSSLWSLTTAPEVVIVGFADVDGDGRSDRERLTDLVRRAGGRIEAGVSSGTALVVDLGSPSGPNIERIAPDWPTESKERDRALRDAKTHGIRVAGTADLLDMLGLEPDAFAAGRFPRQRDTTRLPPVR